MKEFFKKNWKLISIISAAAVAVIVTVVLCVCLIPSGKSKLATPENLSVSTENVLTWDEVENADSGYTVKIGDDETTKVSTNSLDLTTVTAKLKDGENKLSVKANATDGYDASDYSAEVTYNYSSKTPFDKLAAPTLGGDDGRTVNWTAVEGADNGYTVKVGDKVYTAETNSFDLNTVKADLINGHSYNVSVKVNAAGNHTDSEYSDTVSYDHNLTPAEAAADFKASVEAIGEVTAESKDKIDIAKAKLETLDDEAKGIDGVDTAIATLKTKDCAYFAVLIADIKTVDASLTVEDKNANDAAVTAANAYYEDKLLDNTSEEALAVKATLDEKQGAYEAVLTAIDTTISNLKAEIEDLGLTGTIPADKVNVEYYNTLTALQEKIEALGTGYAASLWTDENAELTKAVADEIDALLIIPNTMETSESTVFINRDHGAKTSAIYVTATFKNILGDALTTTEAPTITIDDIEDVSGEKVTYNETEKCYVYTVSFTCPTADTPTEVTYKIGNGEPVTKTIAYPTSIIYSTDKDYKFIQDGVLTCYGVPADTPLFADVYAANAITATGRDNDISVNAAKLATISITNEMTEDALKSAIARKDILGENLKLRLVIYELKDGVYSTINSSSVSETLNYTLTEQDKLVRIPFTVVNGALEITSDGGFICGSDIDYELIISTFNDSKIATADDVRKQLDFHVCVLKNHEQAGDFYASIPGNGTLDGATVKRYVYYFCGELASSDVITLKVSLALKEGSEYANTLRESLVSPEKVWNFTATAEDTRFSGNGLVNVAIGATEAKDGTFGYGAWEWANWENSGANAEGVRKDYFHDYHDGLAILVFEATGIKDAETYDFVAGGVKPFAIYTHTIFSEINWTAVNAAIDEAWAKLPAAQRTNEKSFVFASMVIANEKGLKAGYTDSLPHYFVNNTDATKHAVVKYERDFSVPGNQVGFNTEGTVFTFLEANQPGARGSIYDDIYGVEYIEMVFTVGGKDYMAYLLKGAYNEETKEYQLDMHTKLDKSGAVSNCDRVVNGWMNVGDFVTWANTNYSLTLDSTLTGVTFKTKIHHDGSYFVDGEGDGYSAPVTSPKAAATQG